MFDAQRLLMPSAPFFTLLDGDAAILEKALISLKAQPEATVGEVESPGDGRAPSLVKAIGKALAFPDYFGANWDAVDECLSDLEWLPSRRVVLVFRDAGRLLNLPPDDLEILSEILVTTAEAWAEAHSPATPMSFHILFQDLAPALDRWEHTFRTLEIPFIRVRT